MYLELGFGWIEYQRTLLFVDFSSKTHKMDYFWVILSLFFWKKHDKQVFHSKKTIDLVRPFWVQTKRCSQSIGDIKRIHKLFRINRLEFTKPPKIMRTEQRVEWRLLSSHFMYFYIQFSTIKVQFFLSWLFYSICDCLLWFVSVVPDSFFFQYYFTISLCFSKNWLQCCVKNLFVAIWIIIWNRKNRVRQVEQGNRKICSNNFHVWAGDEESRLKHSAHHKFKRRDVHLTWPNLFERYNE